MSLLPTLEREPHGPGQFAVIWLHGLGADGHDFEPVLPHLGVQLPIRFIFPHAPHRAVTINGGLSMPAWYDIFDMDIPRKVDEAGMESSRQQINALIEREILRGIPAAKIALLGFSQGAVMALHTGLRYPEKLAGLLALSGYLVAPERLTTEAHNANRKTPIGVMHGQYDQVIPMDYGKAAFEALQKLGYTAEWQAYPMAHEVTLTQLRHIGAWLQARFATA